MRPRALLALQALATAIALSVAATPAAAGCLLEYDACSGCAQALLWDGVKLLSASKIREANLYQADCSIDLWHCMMYDSHHQYRCPV